MGRVLLAFQPESAIDAYFERASLRRLTEHTETNPAALRRILKEVRTKGYAAIQDELDYGIVSVALPIFGPHGRIVAAANCSDVTNRLDRDTMIKKRLPVLRQAVRRIEGMLTQHPELTNSVESVASDYVRSRGVARVGQPRQKSSGRLQRDASTVGFASYGLQDSESRILRSPPENGDRFVIPCPSVTVMIWFAATHASVLEPAARPPDVDTLDPRRVAQARRATRRSF